jgi:hypothetical protein
MKKSQLLTAMGLLTIFGLGIVAAGLFSVSQLSDYTLSQAWNALWEQHPAFAWAMSFYCAAMMTFDLWVIAGAITQASQQKDIVMSPGISPSSQQKEII